MTMESPIQMGGWVAINSSSLQIDLLVKEWEGETMLLVEYWWNLPKFQKSALKDEFVTRPDWSRMSTWASLWIHDQSLWGLEVKIQGSGRLRRGRMIVIGIGWSTMKLFGLGIRRCRCRRSFYCRAHHVGVRIRVKIENQMILKKEAEDRRFWGNHDTMMLRYMYYERSWWNVSLIVQLLTMAGPL